MGTSRPYFAGVAAREQLSAVGDVSCLDREVLAIDVQDGVAIGQQVLRPIPHQALPRPDMYPPLRIGRNPDRDARRPTAPTTKCRQVNFGRRRGRGCKIVVSCHG
jgi:hypothetical protein